MTRAAVKADRRARARAQMEVFQAACLLRSLAEDTGEWILRSAAIYLCKTYLGDYEALPGVLQRLIPDEPEPRD